MKNRSILLIVVSSIVLLGFLALLIISLSLAYVRSDDFLDDPAHQYQYIERNREKNIANVGYVSLPDQSIKENDYISFRDEFGDNILISNFGDKEFECTGTCYCEDSDRRTAIPLIRKSISYLLVAVTSLAAIERAKNYFDSKCIEELSDVCHLSKIKTIFDDCEDILIEDWADTIIERRLNEEHRDFFCYGNCVKNEELEKEVSYVYHIIFFFDSLDTKLTYNHFISSKLAKRYFEDIKCEKLKRQGKIKVYLSDLETLPETEVAVNEKYRKIAQEYFQIYILKEFCINNSRDMDPIPGSHLSGDKAVKYATKIAKLKREYNEDHREFGCIGRKDDIGLQNVKCRQIKPLSKSPRSKVLWKKFGEEKRKWDQS